MRSIRWLAAILFASWSAAAQAAPQSYCYNGVDSSVCVTCNGKDCKLGDASSNAKTGIVDITSAGQHVQITASPLNRILAIRHIRWEYIVVMAPVVTTAGDTAKQCEADVSFMPITFDPKGASDFLAKANPADHMGQILSRTPFTVYGFTGTDTLANDTEDKEFILSRDLAYQNLVLEKMCTYAAEPALANAHWQDIRLTFEPVVK